MVISQAAVEDCACADIWLLTQLPYVSSLISITLTSLVETRLMKSHSQTVQCENLELK